MIRALIGIALVAGLTGPAFAQQPTKVELKDAQGKPIGTVTLAPAANGVSIALDVKGLPPGEHALHVHMTPKCEGPAFTQRRWTLQPGQQEAWHEESGRPTPAT